MTMSDPLGDMLTRIRNGQSARHRVVSSPVSKLRSNVLDVLKREGYIRGWNVNEPDAGTRGAMAELSIELKYHEGEPVIREIKRVSKPGRRVYSKIKDLPRVYNGLGIAILSTPRGVMSDNEARAANVGGEVLCQVF
jgi:small subunit ribosomal protein S8